MAFEKLPPRWEAAGVQPTEEKMTSGWLPREKVPAPWLNWYFNGVYESLKEMQEKAITAEDIGDIGTTAETNAKKYADDNFNKPSELLTANLVKNSSALLGLRGWTKATGDKWTHLTAQNEAVYGAFYLPSGDISGSQILESDEIVVASNTPGHVQCEFYTSQTTGGALYLEVYDVTNSAVLATLNATLNRGWHRAEASIPDVGSTGKIKIRIIATDLVGTARGRMISRIKYVARMKKDTPYTMEGDIATISEAVTMVPEVNETSMYASGKDSNGKYTTLQWKRKDGTLFKKSVLSGLSGENYTIQTITWYASNGTSVVKTEIYDLTYDEDGFLISEVKR